MCITYSLIDYQVKISNLLLFYTEATLKMFKKAKESDVGEAVAEFLRNAPDRPGGLKFTVCSCQVLAFYVLYYECIYGQAESR
jgi:hypothetical protein